MLRSWNHESLGIHFFILFVEFSLKAHRCIGTFFKTLKTTYLLVITELNMTDTRGLWLHVLFIVDANLHYVNRLPVVPYCMLKISDFKINFTYRTVDLQFRKQIRFAFLKQSLCFSFWEELYWFEYNTVLQQSITLIYILMLSIYMSLPCMCIFLSL